MSQQRVGQPGLGVYLVAGLLSNVPLMFLVLFLTFFEPKLLSDYMLYFQVLFFSVMLGGAALSGYFVVRRFMDRPQILGLVTGSLGYVIYFVYSFMFYGDYMVLGGFWPMVAFILGGASGGQLSKLMNKRKPRLS